MHHTSLGFFSWLKRGCRQRGHRIRTSDGKKTKSLQPTHPWSWSSTALAFSSSMRSSFFPCPLFSIIGLRIFSIVASVLFVHPVVRCEHRSSCQNVPVSQATPSLTPAFIFKFDSNNSIAPRGCVVVGFFKTPGVCFKKNPGVDF